MAGSRPPGQRRRRERASGEDRQQRLVLIATGVVLALVAVVVVVGVFVTWYLPPRAHVLTAGDRHFTAAEVADRARYLASIGNGNAQRNPAEEGINSLVSQQILFEVGAGLVDPVTEEEVRAAIAERLGLADEFTDQDYGEALGSYLREAPIDRASLEDVVRAGIIEERLEEKFRAELPEAGEQLQLLAVATESRGLAQRLIEAVRDGQDFTEAAVELEIVESPDDVIDLGWFAPTSLNDRVAPFIEGLDAGEVSEVVEDARGIGVEVYYVVERTTDEPYQDEVRDQLARRAFNEWREEQESQFVVDRDLDDSEADWIRQRVQEALSG